MKRELIRYLLQGLIFIAPITITLYIILRLTFFLDVSLRFLLAYLIGPTIPGLGIVMMILLLIVIGYLAQSYIGRPLKNALDAFISRVPILNLIYSAFSDLFSSLIGSERKFNNPVMVKVNPVTNLEKLGFLTEENLEALDELDKVAVYFPHSYNFSGEMFIVPREQVRPIDVPPSEAMKFIVSGGITELKRVD